MADRDCSKCFVKNLQKIHRLMEKRTLGKLPEEVRESLLQAKRQLRLLLRGLIGHALGERKSHLYEVCDGKFIKRLATNKCQASQEPSLLTPLPPTYP